jgi:hypothetical protein
MTKRLENLGERPDLKPGKSASMDAFVVVS